MNNDEYLLPYDEDAWIKKCGTYAFALVDKVTGKFIIILYECGSWRCLKCRTKKLAIVRKKLRYLVPKYDLGVFLTLTTKNKDVKHLTKLFRTLREHTLSNLDMKRFMSKNKGYTEEQAKEIIEKRITDFIKRDIEISIHIIVTPKARINVAKRHNINYNSLDDEDKEKFSEIYQNEIEKERRIEQKKYTESENQKYYYRDKISRRKIYYPAYKDLCASIKNRYSQLYANSKILKKFDAFWVLEFQKNGNPHFHILMNWYIPLSIIENVTKCEEFEDSKIYSEQILKETLSLSKVPKRKSSNRVVGYLLKYLTKSIDPFYSLKHDYNGNIIHFSKKLFGEKGLFKNRNSNRYTLIKRCNRLRKFKKSVARCIEVATKGDLDNQKHFEFIKNPVYQKYKEDIEKCDPEIQNDLKFNITTLLRMYSYSQKFVFDSDSIIRLMSAKYLKNCYRFTKEHEEAIKIICNSQKLIFLNSSAGTSKTTLIANFINTLIENNIMPKEEIGAYALQNITVRNLSLLCNVRCETLHKAGGSYINGEFYKDEYNCLDKDLIFIDEIGRLEPDFFLKKILPFVKPNAKIIVAGDPRQLKGFRVKKGETLDALLSHCPYVDNAVLTENFRSNYSVKAVIKKFENKEEIGDIKSFDSLIEYLKERNCTDQVLTNDRRTTDRINDAFLKDGEMQTGCPVICTRTYNQKGVCNCDTGTLIDIKEDSLTVKFNINGQEKTITFEEEETLDISPAYAITTHKSQGSGFKSVVAFYGADAENTEHVNNRNSLYTAITRARESITIFFEDEETKKMCHNVEL